eukprot:3038670-Rhodomonas_salina.1
MDSSNQLNKTPVRRCVSERLCLRWRLPGAVRWCSGRRGGGLEGHLDARVGCEGVEAAIRKPRHSLRVDSPEHGGKCEARGGESNTQEHITHIRHIRETHQKDTSERLERHIRHIRDIRHVTKHSQQTPTNKDGGAGRGAHAAWRAAAVCTKHDTCAADKGGTSQADTADVSHEDKRIGEHVAVG